MGGPRAAIFGVSGLVLDPRERAFLRAADPWGLILFARNVDTPGQVRALVSEMREAVGRNAPVLIDQEGGRVARLRAPHWREWPPVAELFDGSRREDAARAALAARYRTIADELRDLGIDVNCAPLLDLPVAGSHAVIGARALGSEPGIVAARAKVVCEALLSGGVLPVIKHIPGHGRATVDSHAGLPRVSTLADELDRTDFAAFRPVAGEVLGMTAHIVYEALDAERPATLSPTVIDIVRRRIGFDGCLMTDDLSMHALTGPMADRVRQALAADCDLILHCNGDMAEMEEIAAATPRLEGRALERAARAIAARDEALAAARAAHNSNDNNRAVTVMGAHA